MSVQHRAWRSRMKKHLVNVMAIGLVIAVCFWLPAPAAAQNATKNTPDFSGVWQAPYTPDLTKPLGHDLPYTPYGLDRFKSVVHADDPSSYCLPVGPARGIQAPMPFQIVQNPGLVVILFEYQRTFR